MKRLITLGILAVSLSLILFLPIVNAQETENPGITPDSPFWGIDKAFEQLSLFLTTSPEAKSIKGLEIASERLAEIKEMIEENKLEAAEKAEESHGKTLAKVEENIDKIEKDNSTEEIKEIIEIEKELGEHSEEVEQVFGELKIKIKIEGEITPEQQALIDSILASLEGQTGEVEIKIENKKDETKIKIKIETGKSDEEIEDEIEKLEIDAGVSGIEVKAEIVGSQSEVKIERKFSTTTTDRDAIIDEIIQKFALDSEMADVALELEVEDEDEELKEKFKVEVEIEEGIAEVKVKLKFILDTTDRGEILTAVIEKSQLTRGQIEDVMEFEVEEEELEIEVEIEYGVAEIEVEFDGEEFEFSLKTTLETTDRDAIIDEIIERTGLTREQIENVIEFDIEEEELEIEVEIEDGVAEIEIEFNGEEFEFSLETTDRDAIIDEIIERTGLTRNEIESVIKFDIEEEDDDSDLELNETEEEEEENNET